MDERRDKQPQPEPGAQPPPLIASGTSRLSPVQEAWGAYVDHSLHCDMCRSRDAGSCGEASRLHRVYEEAGGAAFKKLGEAI